MAEEYCGATNWWDSTPSNRSRFDGGGTGGGGGSSTTSSTTTLTNTGDGPGFGWLTDGPTPVDTKMDSTSLQLVGLGLSSQAMAEWNQEPALLRNPEKADNSFRSMLQEGMGLNTNFQQDATGGGLIFASNSNNNNSSQINQRREKLFEGNEDLSPEFKQMGRGFSLDSQQPQFSPSGSSIESTITCQGLAPPSGFQHDSSSTSSVFGSPSSILQGLMGGPDQQHQQHQQQINSNFQHNYFGNEQHHHQAQLSSSWAKVPQFLRASSPKQQQQQQQQRQQEQHHLQFINNAAYWSGSASLNEVRPNLFSSLQGAQLPTMPTFEEKQKTTMEVRDTNSIVKKSNSENNTKRTRNDGASSTLPPFKVRKEKMGDRITALQQLVSPFGKTDTASVLSEAIEYIKFLHEQVLSNPYLKSGGSYHQHQQSNEKAKMDPDGPKQDLRSRGLCLVPVSSTFPVTHETTVDFWTPTFGGTFR
ncbi:transcription factor bHLH123-like isoform X2 [Amaranthus tricolor]|uniref:transcription factor bHLH123-like isoform X2 n=1 Tax=Amaranthus tricolor TaxID=29722 RepID=UPI00258D661F|nr:transcription factor bHLH123-like isoform X2 [Amaranthus tricolor]